jgi:hypothetical protein
VLASDGIDLPVLNVFGCFAKMDGERVAVASSGQIPLVDILKDGVRGSAGRFRHRQPGTTPVMCAHLALS